MWRRALLRSAAGAMLTLAAIIPAGAQTGAAGGETARAIALAEGGDLDAALALLEPYRQRPDAPLETLATLGRLYLLGQRLEDAWTVLGPLAARPGADPGVRLDAARAALATGRQDDALPLLASVAEAAPESEATRLLGLVELGRGRHLEAYVHLAPWVRAHPDDHAARLAAAACAVVLERLPEADTLLADLPLSNPRVRLLRGDVLLRRTRSAEAAAMLEPLAATPQPPAIAGELRRLLGRAYLGSQRPEAAVELLAGHTGERADLALLLAEAHYLAGDAGAAIAALKPHAGRADVDPELGRLLLQAGRHAEAARALERAVVADPDHQASWQFLSQAHFALGARAEAATAAERARALATVARPQSHRQTEYLWRLENPTASRLRRAIALRDAGRLEEAMAIVEQELPLDPDNARLRFVASGLALRLGDPARALALAKAGVALAPEEADGYARRAMALLATGGAENEARAETDLRRALELAPHHPGATNRLALLLIERRELDAARALLEGLLAADPDNRVARDSLARLDAAGGRSR